MRIVFVLRCHLYYTAELANGLARLGHDVMIIAPTSGSDFAVSENGKIEDEYREVLDSRIGLYWINFPYGTTLRNIADNIRCIAGLRSLIHNHKPDILHLHDISDYRVQFTTELFRRKLPIILTVHDAELHPGHSSNKTEFLRPRLRRMADKIIVHGDYVKQQLTKISGIPDSKISIIPHGAYTLYRRWLSGSNHGDTKNLLFFGRVHKYKGLEYLIKAAPAIYTQIPNVRFVIAGSGPDWDRCKSLIDNPEYFVLRNEYIYNHDVARLFEETDVVVLPYIEASQSGVLAVAYAFGKPVVVTNVGSLPEVVDEGVTGFVVPPRDVNALADAIIKILKDESLRERMSENAYRKAITDLSWDSIAARTEELYRSAI